jgi:hypothetical protein
VRIETAVPAGKPVAAQVPEALGKRRQLGAQRVPMEFLEAGVYAAAEQREEIRVREVADPGQFEFQQGGLPRIGVHRVNAPRRQQGIVEHIATGAGDDQHGVVTTQVERAAVDGRVLPASVVDQRARIHRIEDPLIDTISERELRIQCGLRAKHCVRRVGRTN